MTSKLIVVTLARRPLAKGTVAANVMAHGVGALNIEGSRIPYGPNENIDLDKQQRQQATGGNTSVPGAVGAEALVGKEIPTYKPGGRWPANLILQHSDGCVGSTCSPNCVIADVNKQSGDSAHYFKQLSHVEGLPQDLTDYLRDLVTPGEAQLGAPGLCYVSGCVDEAWLQNAADQSHHALIIRGEPSKAAAAHMSRVLKPGGHLCLVAPETCPTGHRGACTVEDAGFEIRDAILWAQGSGKVHYVAKPGKAEREAGTAHLAAQPSGAQSDGARGNTHPTIKPKDVMVRILNNVPKDQGPVLDPFLGSGTTLIACLETGHDGIGIEREAEYLAIADARVKHWNNAQSGWNTVQIDSDYRSEEAESEVTLEELLGL